MLNRRDFLGASAAISTIALAGCSKILQQEAKPARFKPTAINETKYSLKEANKVSSKSILKKINPNLNKNISIDAYIISYYHNALPQSITAISTPSFSRFGKELNPIATVDTKKTLKLFAGRIRQDESNLQIKSITKKDKKSIQTTEGEQILEIFDVKMNSLDWGEIYFDFLVVKYTFDTSVVLSAAVVLREIPGLPIDYSIAYEKERATAKKLLSKIDYPVSWDNITDSISR